MCMHKTGHRRFPEDKPPHRDLSMFSYQTNFPTPAFLGGTQWSSTTIQASPVITTIRSYSATPAHLTAPQNK